MNTINKVYLVIFLFILTSCGALPKQETVKSQDLIYINIPQLSKTKAIILGSLIQNHASDYEKSLVLAIASIETYAMCVDYPEGDKKTEGAYNFGIYKMNRDLARIVDPNANITKAHNDINYATQLVLQGLRTLGYKKYLTIHRGGLGALYNKIPKSDIDNYINAVVQISKAYLATRDQLDPCSTDDLRITTFVPAI